MIYLAAGRLAEGSWTLVPFTKEIHKQFVEWLKLWFDWLKEHLGSRKNCFALVHILLLWWLP